MVRGSQPLLKVQGEWNSEFETVMIFGIVDLSAQSRSPELSSYKIGSSQHAIMALLQLREAGTRRPGTPAPQPHVNSEVAVDLS